MKDLINWSQHPEDPDDWTFKEIAQYFTDWCWLVAIKAGRKWDIKEENEN